MVRSLADRTFQLRQAPREAPDAEGNLDIIVGEKKAESYPGTGEVFKSRRAAAGRAELLANFFGGAVWGNFRENANCGDPSGTLPVPFTYPVHFAGA